MPRQISDAFHRGKEWFTSTTGAPLRAAYAFLFPPLDDLSIDDAGAPDTMDWRPSNAQMTVYERSMSVSSPSASSPLTDESMDGLDMWDSFSSPWSFLTSRYTVALVIVAIVNNRVQHICRPRGGGTARLSQLQRIALRLPSLVLLARTVLIFMTVAADAFLSERNPVNVLLGICTSPSWRNAWLANTPMSGWAFDRFGSSSRDALLRARDASALWAAFTATSIAVISDAVVRNLDADREEPPAFNLVGFAFLLHYHSFAPDAPANEHVYLCILLQMFQILAIALSRCRRPVYAPRLLISSTFGISSLLHYALAASSGRYPFLEALSRTPEIALVLVVLLTITLHALTMLLLEGGIQPHRLLFSRSNLPSLDEDWSLALFKLGTACMESTRLTGLEREVEPLVAWGEPYIELSQSGHIGLVDPLLPRSAASRLQHHASPQHGSGQLGGLFREIKEVRIEPTLQSSSSSSFGHAGLARFRAFTQFIVATLLVLRNLALITFSKILRLVGLPDPSVPQWIYHTLRIVRLVWHGRNGEARRRERRMAEAQRNREHQEQQQRYRHQRRVTEVPSSRLQQDPSSSGVPSARPLRAFSRLYQAGTPSHGWHVVGTDPGLQGSTTLPESRHSDDLPTQALGRDPSRGMSVVAEYAGSDEDDDDYDFDNSRIEREDAHNSEDDDEGAESAEEFKVEADEVSCLLEEFGSFAEGEGADNHAASSHLALRSGTQPFNQVLLAHMTRARNQPPLTRSGFNSLVRFSTFGSDGLGPWPLPRAQADYNLARSMMDRRNDLGSHGGHERSAGEEARRLCVVCCTEERNVICWPCRCLCLCMECREHLASRPPARRSVVNGGNGTRSQDEATHLCPTCRTPVQAFSRLYIP